MSRVPKGVNAMKLLGIALVTLGIIALVYGGFSYNRERTVIDMGALKATATEHHALPVSPIVGVIAIVGGLLLAITPRRRSQS
jgi:uncharacterized membrane protein YidH (DUF202 family)